MEICRMRSLVSWLTAATIFSLLAVLFGCSAAVVKSDTTAANNQQQQPLPRTSPAGDGAARITVADLREALDKGTAYVVDVRTDDQYKSGHIKGAVHIPEMNIAARASELPRDKTIVTYCS
jgi:3-mercaptopyruvate sulfurtransferase SseA